MSVSHRRQEVIARATRRPAHVRLLQVLLEPDHRVEVEVGSTAVEQQQPRLAEERARALNEPRQPPEKDRRWAINFCSSRNWRPVRFADARASAESAPMRLRARAPRSRAPRSRRPRRRRPGSCHPRRPSPPGWSPRARSSHLRADLAALALESLLRDCSSAPSASCALVELLPGAAGAGGPRAPPSRPRELVCDAATPPARRAGVHLRREVPALISSFVCLPIAALRNPGLAYEGAVGPRGRPRPRRAERAVLKRVLPAHRDGKFVHVHSSLPSIDPLKVY